MSGKAFTRHLMVLKLIAMEDGIEIPSLFLDPSFLKCYYLSMSTSQVGFFPNLMLKCMHAFLL